MTIKRLFGFSQDPSEWSGKNALCKVCGEKEVEINDDYCEDHQRCYDCGENDYCDCKETLYCICGRYKEDGFSLCNICLND